MRVEHNGQRERGREREVLTVCFMGLVENFLLKVLLILHRWVEFGVIVLKQTDSEQVGRGSTSIYASILTS